jgi:predicted esterase
LQLHHAITDDVVPVTASILLQSEMEAAGRPSELYLYEADSHDIDNNFFTAMRRTVEFFDVWVKGE